MAKIPFVATLVTSLSEACVRQHAARRCGSLTVTAGLAFGLAGNAHAQQVPDAGSLLRGPEQQTTPELPKPGAPAKASPRENATPIGPTLVVKTFRFEGNSRFSEAQLQKVLADYLKRPVTLADLENAAATVAQHYRSAGWLARVFVPPQEVDGGVIRLRVIEATYGQSRFSDDTDVPSLRVDKALIVDRVQARQGTGEKFNISSVERGLLIADDLPGVQVAGSQIGGKKEGETDVLLKASKEPLAYGELGADNYGSRSTGSERLLARLGLNSPLHRGDQFDLQTQFTEYMQYARLAGSMPIGADGLRLGANAAALHYKVGTPEFHTLEPRGSSSVWGADLTYPLVRATDRNLYLGASYQQTRPYNTAVTGVVSDYAVNDSLLRLDANLFDTLGGGGITAVNLTQVFGDVDLDGSPSQAADKATANTQGDFRATRYRLTRTQRIASSLSAFVSYNGQIASKNLDSSEKFYLGGPYGVRAYPLYEGSGSEGQLASAELRWQLPQGCELSAFYDWGRVKVNEHDDFPGAAALNRYELKGYGVGFSAQLPARLRASAVAAWRDGRNPNPTPAGNDQDGSLRDPRFWLSLSWSF
ncbi:MAG TPA: ShlB/FhaC/HecB family hemolysin secretion/activation protein [Burkholderiales bacterium]|nr:ShlB/FhaC/HecB family hemolysin secretion/activation protein [Burkholderiales bacterium]